MTKVAQQTGTVTIQANPLPFQDTWVTREINYCNETISEILQSFGANLEYFHASVWINGQFIPKDYWENVTPKPNATVAVQALPAGGGDSDAKVVSTVALAVAAAFTAGSAFGIGGLGKTAFTVGSTSFTYGQVGAFVTGLAGQLIASAIAEAPSFERTRDDTERDGIQPSLTSTRNQANQYGAIPLLLGKHKIFPLKGAEPFTEVVGDNKYLRELLVVGYGPIEIDRDSIKIGNTDIDQFDDVDIEIREGKDGESPRQLYTDDISQNNFQITLRQSDGYISRTTEPNADEIIVDITFPRGLANFENTNNNSGKSESVTFDIEYKKTSDSSWTAINESPVTISNSSTSRFSRSFRWTVDTDQYDVRLRRRTKDHQNNANILSTSVWSELTTVRSRDPIQFDEANLATISLRIRATEQLSGQIEQLSLVAERIAKDYDAQQDQWIERPTSNPASLYRYVLQSPAASRQIPDSRIDLDRLEEWHQQAENKNFTYSTVVDTKDITFELLNEIAAVGRASFNQLDGEFSVVLDKSKSVPVQHFTPRNSTNFSGEKSFFEQPDALRVQFVNEEKDYQQDERLVFDDGKNKTNAENFEKLDLPGVTDPQHAWKLGRYHLAQGRLRPERFTIQTDIENVVCTRGDLVKVSYDVPLVGQTAGRVKEQIVDNSGNVEGVILDEEIEMEQAEDYSITFRIVGTNATKTINKNVELNVGTQDRVIFENEIPSSNDAPQFDDLFSFGIREQVTNDFKVKQINAKQELQAELTLVNADDAIHNADQAEIPEYESNLTPPDFLDPPKIVDVRSGGNTVIITDDGSIINQMIVTVEDINGIQFLDRIEAQFKPSSSENWQDVNKKDISTQFDIKPVNTGETYDIRVRAISELGETTAWRNKSHTIVGVGEPPPDVENFDVDILSGSAYLSWDQVEIGDLDYYTIKHSPLESGAKWEDATTVVDNISATTTNTSVVAQSGTYLIKAVDIGDNESDNPARAITNISDIRNLNIVETLVAQPNFTGTKTNVRLAKNDPDKLTLMGSDQVADWDDVSAIASVAYGEAGLHTNGLYEFDQTIDLGSVYQSKLSGLIKATGEKVTNIVKTWDPVADVSSVGGTDPSQWNITIEFRKTNDDPNSSPTWSNWQELTTGDIEARAFQFRANIETTNDSVRPRISKLEATVDMPDRTEGDRDIQSTTNGKTITFDNPFETLETVGVTVDDAEQGDYWTITNKDETGFDVNIFDANDFKVDRQFDWIAKGYGKDVS